MSEPFFREMAERYVEKTADKAVDSGARPTHGAKDKRGLNPAFLAGPVLAQAFDAYSTRQALKAGGGREGNPAMAPFAGNEAALYTTKLGTGALIAFLADRLARSGHRTAGKILSGVSVGVPVAAGIHNLNLAEKNSR